MKTVHIASNNHGGLIEFPSFSNNQYNADATWMMLRSQIMDVKSNPVFPRRQRIPFIKIIGSVTTFLFSGLKPLMKI